MGKLKAKALLSSRVICDTLTPGGRPAIAAAVAASAAAIFRFRSLLLCRTEWAPEGPGIPGVDVAEPIEWATPTDPPITPFPVIGTV